MKYCGNCGKPLVEGAKFCGKCGSKVEYQGQNKKMESSISSSSSKTYEEEPRKGLIALYFDTFKKFYDFNSRASRREYWTFVLGAYLVIFLLGIIEGITGIASDSDESMLAGLFYIVTIVPTLAVGVRRMHDVGKNGWFLLIPLYNLYLVLSPGDDETNKYGSKPVN